MGEIVQAVQPVFAEMETMRLKQYRSQLEPDVQAIDAAIAIGVEKGLLGVTRFYAKDLDKGREILAVLERASDAPIDQEVRCS